mgnify:CR=1 FL=1
MAKNDIEPRSVSVAAPYELPAGWKWIALLDAFENKTSSQKKVPTNEYLKHGQYAIIDQGQEFIGGYTNDESKVFKDNLPVIIFGDHTRNIKFIDFPFAQGADGIKVLKPKDFLDAIFFYYGLKNIVFPDLGYRRHFPLFKNFYFPLPPTLAEQQRIVSRIESLFAKLDEAKDKAQSVVDGSELRRAAILHKAFTGELTAKWRKEHGVSDDSWEEKTIGDCLFPMTTKMPSGETFRYIDIESIDNRTQTVKNPKIIAVSEAPSRASRELKENDVLFSMVRPYLKNIAVIDKSLCDCIASTGFYVCRCNGMLNYRYLYNLLCSKDAIDYLMQFMKGDNSPSIRKNDLLEMSINLPTLAEQQEIVRILDSVLEKEADAKETAEYVLEQIDLLKKSILARAFRGEL